MEQPTKKSVLLVMDMQAGIVGMMPDASTVLGNNVKAIAKARANNIPVIYIVVGFRNGAPEVSANNKTFSGIAERLHGVNMADFMAVHNDLKPLDNEVVVVKRRVSAFTGSDLEVILRAYGADHLILTGIATSGVVLSTLREAADKDYKLTVLADCCADNDEEIHRVLINKVFPRQADVVEWSAWMPEQ